MLLGGARDDEDVARVNELKKFACDLGVDVSVCFHHAVMSDVCMHGGFLACSAVLRAIPPQHAVLQTAGRARYGLHCPSSSLGANAMLVMRSSIFKLSSLFPGRSLIGLHTMWCEHFGIGVVEMMVRPIFSRELYGSGCVTSESLPLLFSSVRCATRLRGSPPSPIAPVGR